MKHFCRRNTRVEERIFNYRLSGAGRILEKAFGIPSNRFLCHLGNMGARNNQKHRLCGDVLSFMRKRYRALQNSALNWEDEVMATHMEPGDRMAAWMTWSL